ATAAATVVPDLIGGNVRTEKSGFSPLSGTSAQFTTERAIPECSDKTRCGVKTSPVRLGPMAPTASQLEEHRTALTGHCYRMLGSAIEADDAVQETIVRAWRSLDRFDGRASLRTWLYRIATNVCLDALSDRSRRARPMELGPEGSVDDP